MAEKGTQFDDILKLLGQFGRFQRRQYFLLCLPVILTACHTGASVFIAATPKFRCELPSGAFNGSDTYEVQNEAHNDSLFTHIPVEDGQFESCHILSNVSAEITSRDETVSLKSNDSVVCSSYVYSQEEFRSTIVTEWGLVCENQVKATLSTSVYMIGSLVGSLISGFVSDTCGRRRGLLIAILIHSVCGLAVAFSPNYIAFVTLRFFTAMATDGVYVISYVLALELIGPKYRLALAILHSYCYAFGYVILSGIAYFTRQWNYTQMAISGPSFLLVSYYWLVTESPRWLLSKGKVQHAEELIQKAGKINKKSMPTSVLESFKENATPTDNISSLARAKHLCLRIIILLFNWFAISVGYYGLTLNSGNIGGSTYLNSALVGIIEIPAYTACFLCNKLGRKPFHITGMLIGGLACIGTVLVDRLVQGNNETMLNAVFVTLNIVGKFGLTISYFTIYLWSAESYPTGLRSSLLGISSLLSALGGIVAPFIADMGNYLPLEYKRTLPASVISALVIVAGLLSLNLPETMGRNLPQSIKEADAPVTRTN